jgi:UDP-3-O-[3-hydroxymyristoyl] glucosamine N-acyltransferase
LALTLGELAVRHGCALRGDPDAVVERVATLRGADGHAITFLANPAYRSQLKDTRAAAVILDPGAADDCPVAALITPEPYAVFARVAADLHPLPPAMPGVHPSALVDTLATVPVSCEIGPGAVIGAGAMLGERVVIGARCVISPGVRMGDDCRLYPGVILYAGVSLGSRVTLHAGAVLGSDGFGFARERDGRYTKVPQVGGVRVGDDVEIGANTTVDRGAIGDTVIGDGVKLDNQIQVGHNVVIGPHTVIAAQTGIAGSATIGARCTIGGQAGIAGHLTIADDVVIAGGAAVTGSIRRAGVYGGGGTPADDIRRWRRNMARFGQLDELVRRVQSLEKQLRQAGEAPED